MHYEEEAWEMFLKILLLFGVIVLGAHWETPCPLNVAVHQSFTWESLVGVTFEDMNCSVS